MYSGFFHAGKENQMDRNVNVITDLNGKKVVVINDIYFMESSISNGMM